MRFALILAGGGGTRWNGPGPKQLVWADDRQPLLWRTASQIVRAGIRPVVKTTNAAVLKSVALFAPPVLVWHSASEKAEAVLEAEPLWGEVFTVLFGDVFYSERAMSAILSSEGGISIHARIRGRAGKGAEVYALQFRAQVHPLLRKLLDSVRESDRPVWELYQNWLTVKKDEVLREINDDTEDFDTLEEFRMWRETIWRNEDSPLVQTHG